MPVTRPQPIHPPYLHMLICPECKTTVRRGPDRSSRSCPHCLRHDHVAMRMVPLAPSRQGSLKRYEQRL